MEPKVTIIGHDGFSLIARMDFDERFHFYRLTNCCQASGKGVEYGTNVACRACYQTVDPDFGNAWGEDEIDIVARMVGKTPEEIVA